ncbi:NitT/TauT family transport system ATP-binding protein [Rhizobiales bacterium GAS191]|nr:NitT/TauT family transport system ATP-binding protein [Rhizobiales bacterium GAS113]SEB94511.1 NitT/TauT family transport system ATP-binding protein [Rhizobiales bacterium GAS188]SED28694.1 NitT/TauT family transport system ATP-binding protein [Rhizobiales bacterium GAS191]
MTAARLRDDVSAAATVVTMPVRPRNLIELRAVEKSYGSLRSLNPIDLTVKAGEFIVIVGPSGCGKSTLLKLIAGLLAPSAGEIVLEGKRVRGPPDDIGIVFQTPVLLAWRSVMSNIMLQIEMRGLRQAAYVERAKALIKTSGLEGFEDKYPWQLSGGMQQRAAICRALVHDPSLLLMDEPFGALDAMTREKMNAGLQRIWLETRKTVVLITHSIAEAVFLADRVVVMSQRPGSIEAVYDVGLPRPRPLSLMAKPEFTEITEKIRHHFFTDGAVD